jgi:hypothetical protein
MLSSIENLGEFSLLGRDGDLDLTVSALLAPVAETDPPHPPD